MLPILFSVVFFIWRALNTCIYQKGISQMLSSASSFACSTFTWALSQFWLHPWIPVKPWVLASHVGTIRFRCCVWATPRGINTRPAPSLPPCGQRPRSTCEREFTAVQERSLQVTEQRRFCPVSLIRPPFQKKCWVPLKTWDVMWILSVSGGICLWFPLKMYKCCIIVLSLHNCICHT